MAGRILRYQELMGSNVRRLRIARREGLRQDDLAARMRQLGLTRWTRATVAAVELGKRDLSLGEAWLLQLAAGWPISELLTLPGDVRDVEGIDIEGVVFHPQFWNKFVMDPVPTFPLFDLRGVNPRLQELGPADRRIVDRYQLSAKLIPLAVADRWLSTENRLAGNLRVAALEIACAAYALWGHGVTEERDSRVTRTGKEASDRLRAAHVTKKLQAEIGARIKATRRRKS